jgi:two-component system, OmpR family, sensor histidine kinase KdpD
VRRAVFHVSASAGALALATMFLRLTATNPTTVALGYLLVVLFVAAAAQLWVALSVSAAAMLCFNYFFLPPIGTFTIADPHNWVALLAFVVVSAVASQLSASARAKTREADDRRKELTRLFDLTRDILLTTEREGATTALARHVARRFELDTVTICLPMPDGGWQLHHGGAVGTEPPESALDAAYANARGTLEFDARSRAYGGHSVVTVEVGMMLTLAPVRLGTRVIGLLTVAGRPLEAGTLDAIAGIVAIAVERAQFLDERHVAELARQRAELSAALLASLSHDLRTPLTSIRTAIGNIDSGALDDDQRHEQAHVALEQLARLTRLFDEILDMARIESRTVRAERDWVTPADIVEAAVAYVSGALDGHVLQIDAASDLAIETDPRLTSSALAHLLENAAAYSPPRSAIEVRGWIDEAEGVRFAIRDHGPGLASDEIDHLFEPFYRGQRARNTVPGTGMGLAITRGLLAVEGGRVWAENVPSNGAQFSIAIPGPVRRVEVVRET